eukprot:Cvel_28253.t1-p1 / transcript=Cvel_28253.t1 / gene=Cvel_28253 / organism=Chromera_velia_CCMP2878 / gene_product=Polyadenylate-binding protein, cytoplasmic and, putative / transcript_product=Polyadenylate-binding protein, cytoplasmic and, putative / location=Cvel_scaffold3661:11455-14477(+) / protein_length=299 / sequence_SO=supercontig / SO=protein_coding / is_pseudo=false
MRTPTGPLPHGHERGPHANVPPPQSHQPHPPHPPPRTPPSHSQCPPPPAPAPTHAPSVAPIAPARGRMAPLTDLQARQEALVGCEPGVGPLGANLFVFRLACWVEEQDLRYAFDAFGTITSCKVTRDKDGLSKGFGFVCFSNSWEALAAIQQMDNRLLLPSPQRAAQLIMLSQKQKQRLDREKERGQREANGEVAAQMQMQQQGRRGNQNGTTKGNTEAMEEMRGENEGSTGGSRERDRETINGLSSPILPFSNPSLSGGRGSTLCAAARGRAYSFKIRLRLKDGHDRYMRRALGLGPQ